MAAACALKSETGENGRRSAPTPGRASMARTAKKRVVFGAPTRLVAVRWRSLPLSETNGRQLQIDT